MTSKQDTAAHDIRQTLAVSFSEAMRKRGLNQAQLAKLAGMSEARVSRIIRARATARLDTIARLTSALGMELRLALVPAKDK